MIWEQNEGSELVVVLTMVQVEVATEVMDVFSNVSSNCLLGRMQSSTGCMCLTFHRDVFLNAFSNCLPEKMHLWDSTVRFKCLLKWLALVKR